mgnify:CR=1 FL=1|jgi:uncharacterized Zn finger protein
MEEFSFACKIKCPNCGSLRDAKMIQTQSKNGKNFTWKRLLYDCKDCSVNKIKGRTN